MISNTGLEVLAQKLVSLISGSNRSATFAMPAHGFPMTFPIGVGIPEGVDFVIVPGLFVPLGGMAVKDALKLCFDVFSASCVAHGAELKPKISFGKLLIQNLSKGQFPNNSSRDNLLLLIIIISIMLSNDECLFQAVLHGAVIRADLVLGDDRVIYLHKGLLGGILGFDSYAFKAEALDSRVILFDIVKILARIRARPKVNPDHVIGYHIIRLERAVRIIRIGIRPGRSGVCTGAGRLSNVPDI